MTHTSNLENKVVMIFDYFLLEAEEKPHKIVETTKEKVEMEAEVAEIRLPRVAVELAVASLQRG